MFDRHFAVWPEQVPRKLELPATNLYHNITVSALRYPQHPAIHYYGTDISYRELQFASRFYPYTIYSELRFAW